MSMHTEGEKEMTGSKQRMSFEMDAYIPGECSQIYQFTTAHACTCLPLDLALYVNGGYQWGGADILKSYRWNYNIDIWQ